MTKCQPADTNIFNTVPTGGHVCPLLRITSCAQKSNRVYRLYFYFPCPPVDTCALCLKLHHVTKYPPVGTGFILNLFQFLDQWCLEIEKRLYKLFRFIYLIFFWINNTCRTVQFLILNDFFVFKLYLIFFCSSNY